MVSYHDIVSNLKDWAEIIGLPAAFFAASKAVYEIRESRKLRAEELRWKKANSAKELLDDIHNHELEKSAVRMLDWHDGQAEYEISPGQKATVSYADVLAALAKNGSELRDRKDVYIRDCFDWFFYRVDRIQHYIDRDLIDFDDVKPVFRIYAREIEKHRKIYGAFLNFHEYDLARSFFLRCK
ncbi:MAG TPA: hypothetical protein VJN89_15305 [Candidatus Acidoferrum sp.]|nr:hypothetical protein [Candidatus Acidoferrum sp.]